MKLAHNYYVYVVEGGDGSYYTGVTNDVEKRIAQHCEGLDPNCYTYKRRPVVLKYHEHFFHISNAIAWEKQVKGWSRKKKEALFAGDYKKIRELAK